MRTMLKPALAIWLAKAVPRSPVGPVMAEGGEKREANGELGRREGARKERREELRERERERGGEKKDTNLPKLPFRLRSS